mgnify:CR=1 FL=1
MKLIPYTLVIGSMLLLVCCSQEAREAKGFALPKGDVEKGKLAFAALECHQCHSVADVELPDHPNKSAVSFALGGEVRIVKSGGQLVTSIIQPQHVIAPDYLKTLSSEAEEGQKSPMPSFNEQMKVSQLIDIVAFLHGHYKKVHPSYHGDYYYMP